MASWDFTRTRPGNFAWGHEGAEVLAAQQDRAQAEELRVFFFFLGGGSGVRWRWESYLLHSQGGRCTRQENCRR